MDMHVTPRPLAPDAKLSMTLRADQWNVVMTAMREMPYRLAAPIIEALAEQFNMAAHMPAEDLTHAAPGIDAVENAHAQD